MSDLTEEEKRKVLHAVEHMRLHCASNSYPPSTTSPWREFRDKLKAKWFPEESV